MEGLGEPSYRTAQLFKWVFQKGAASFDDMSDLPKKTREALSKQFHFEVPAVLNSVSERDAVKYLFGLAGDSAIETVVLSHRDWKTVCVSTQAGCRFACAFCASGMNGLERSLTCGEIISQVIHAQHHDGGVRNVVFMGVGEPLDNFDNLAKSIDIINDPDGCGIGARKITVSTCGPKDGITKLASLGKQVELSVSLHAADDTVRSRLMPVNRSNNIASLLSECRNYQQATGRLLTFEYVLASGINDSVEQAENLAKLLKGILCKVNLIMLNPIEGLRFKPSGAKEARAFEQALAAKHIQVTLRHPKGTSINAACGQLRASRTGNASSGKS